MVVENGGTVMGKRRPRKGRKTKIARLIKDERRSKKKSSVMMVQRMKRKGEEDVTGMKAIGSGVVMNGAALEVKVEKECRTHAADDGKIEMESVGRSMSFRHRRRREKKAIPHPPLRLVVDTEG